MLFSIVSKYVDFSRTPTLVPILKSSISSSLSLYNSSMDFSPENPIPSFPKLCTNCKYYFTDGNKIETPRCSRFGSFSFIDGSIYYSRIEIARDLRCKGKYFTHYNSANK